MLKSLNNHFAADRNDSLRLTVTAQNKKRDAMICFQAEKKNVVWRRDVWTPRRLFLEFNRMEIRKKLS